MSVATIQVKDLVDAKLYHNEEAVIQEALRYLFQNRPDLRLTVAVYRYQHDHTLSLARAATMGGVSFEQMKEILVNRGIELRLGPETLDEAKEEVKAIEDWINDHSN